MLAVRKVAIFLIISTTLAAVASPIVKRVDAWFSIPPNAVTWFVGGAGCLVGGCVALDTKATRGVVAAISIGIAQMPSGQRRQQATSPRETKREEKRRSPPCLISTDSASSLTACTTTT